jgi:hypothetical protein
VSRSMSHSEHDEHSIAVVAVAAPASGVVAASESGVVVEQG